jgi:ChrB-like protein
MATPVPYAAGVPRNFRPARPGHVTMVAHEWVGGQMPGRLEWVLLAYRLPREPSTPRITVWRKLRRLGVAQVVDGLVALPANDRTREQFEWIADEILGASGEAFVWVARLASAAEERTLTGRMTVAVAEEYRRVIHNAVSTKEQPVQPARRGLARLRRDLERIESRDFFPPPEREQARLAVRDLGEALQKTPDQAAPNRRGRA